MAGKIGVVGAGTMGRLQNRALLRVLMLFCSIPLLIWRPKDTKALRRVLTGACKGKDNR